MWWTHSGSQAKFKKIVKTCWQIQTELIETSTNLLSMIINDVITLQDNVNLSEKIIS